MRILITGGRNWTDEGAVAKAVIREIDRLSPGQIVLIHGACPTGADAIASRLAKQLGVYERPWPADWEAYGRAAGPMRNQAMVDDGADVCLAFPMPSSRGTFDCMRRAEAAGIRVVNCGERDPGQANPGVARG